MAGKKTVWDLALEITGSDKGASGALRQVKKNIQDVQAAGKQLGGDFKAFTKNAAKLALGVVGGVTAAGAGVLAMAESFASAGDQVAKTADSLGMAIEGYQKLKYAMTDSGLGAEEFDSAIQKMTNTINLGAAGNEAAKKQLQAIGLDAKKLAAMRPEQAFERIADYMNKLPDDAARAQVGITLFGKSAGPRMAAAMRKGSQGIKELGAEAESLGIIMSESQARSSEEYGNQLNRLKQSVTGLKNQFIGSAIGPITEAFAMLRSAIQEQMPAIRELGQSFGKWLASMVRRLPEIIAKIKEFGSWISTTVTKVKDFVGGWKNLAIIVGVLISFKTILSGLKVVMSALNVLSAAGNVIRGIHAALTAKTAAGEAVLTGALIGQKIATIATTAATWALNVAMMLGIIGAIVAVIAGIVLLIKNWDKVVETMKNVGAAIVNFLKPAIDFIKNAFLSVVNFVKNIFGEIFGSIKERINMVIGFFSGGFVEGIKKTFGMIIDIVKKNIRSIILFIINPIAGIFSFLYDHSETFRNFVDGVVNAIKGFFLKFGIDFDAIFSGIHDFALNVFEGIKAAVAAVVDFFKNGFQAGVDAVKGIISGITGIFDNIFSAVGEKIKAFIDFFVGKFQVVKDFFGGIGNAIGNVFSGGKDKGKVPGHAEGGIYNTRHIAEIAEKGAEAIVPLNKSSEGYNIWKQAGEIGGYLKGSTQQASGGAPQSPPVMAAAAQKISGGDNTIRVDFRMTNNFNGGKPDQETAAQIAHAGQQAGDDFEEKVKAVFDSILRNQKRVSYA